MSTNTIVCEEGSVLPDGDTIKILMGRLRKFRDDRNWQEYHTPKNLSMAITKEASELMECFLWQEMPGDGKWKTLRDVEEEVADVFIFLLNFCDVMKIDLIKSAHEKIDKNAVKYPVKE